MKKTMKGSNALSWFSDLNFMQNFKSNVTNLPIVIRFLKPKIERFVT